ncbi:MAG: hypothetical protein M3Q18_09795 [Actinomycetota bacterium]|nr:hypothetical protein [Actinomycetota bacterium]
MTAPRPAPPAPFDPTWGVEVARPSVAAVARAGALLAAPSLLVAVIVVLLAGPAWGGLALLLGVGATVAWVLGQGWLTLRSCGARRIGPGEHPRLTNMVSSLAAQLGIAGVEGAVAPGAEPAAWLCPVGGRAVLVCSEGLLERFTRTEVEAVVASLLVRRRHHGGLVPLVRAAVGSAAGALGGVTPADDVRALSVTRYPPGLASALLRASPERGRRAAFAFAPAEPVAPEVRAAQIRDL